MEGDLASSQVVLVCDGKVHVLASTAEDKSVLQGGLVSLGDTVLNVSGSWKEDELAQSFWASMWLEAGEMVMELVLGGLLPWERGIYQKVSSE